MGGNLAAPMELRLSPNIKCFCSKSRFIAAPPEFLIQSLSSLSLEAELSNAIKFLSKDFGEDLGSSGWGLAML